MKKRKTLESGKRGNVVTSRNRFGSYEMQYSPPRTASTRAQQQWHKVFRIVTLAWRRLTESQRQAWIRAAADAKTRSRLGERHALTGQTYFMRVNCTRLSCGLDMLTEPPKRNDPIIDPVRRLIITNRGGQISLELELAEPPNGELMVFGSRPCSPGCYACFKCPRLGPLPPPEAGLCNISRLYWKKHGTPPVGARIFIRIRPIDASARDHFHEFHAVVPPPEAPTRRPRRL